MRRCYAVQSDAQISDVFNMGDAFEPVMALQSTIKLFQLSITRLYSTKCHQYYNLIYNT